MNVKELKEILKHFNDNTEVCINDHATGSLRPIESVACKREENEPFMVRLSVCGSE